MSSCGLRLQPNILSNMKLHESRARFSRRVNEANITNKNPNGMLKMPGFFKLISGLLNLTIGLLQWSDKSEAVARYSIMS